ncbi:MAG TPA: glycoside hydrolase family 15 protein [Burkholderiales bacterium]
MFDSAFAERPFGYPGIPPRWTSSSKEGVGTACSGASRVWFTISHGILNEVYYPTVDRPQIRDLQFLVTDGATFFHEERRDLENEIECLQGDTLGYRIVTRDPQGRYSITKEIITDPARACVLIHVRLEAAAGWADRLHIYSLLAPHLEGGGMGNSVRRHQAAHKDVLIGWKGRTCVALGVDTRFIATSCGYVGYSDGWQDLKDNFQLDWAFDQADDGNVAVIGEIDPGERREFTMALAFGDSLHASTTALAQSLSLPFSSHRSSFVAEWQQAGRNIPYLAWLSADGGLLYRISHNLLLAHEDKTFKGAIIASASIPWGEARGDEDLGGYHLVWTRDMVHSATALLACGNTEIPRRALVYLAVSQHADGGFSQNFWVDGTAYWSGLQLDEVAFPVVLAWRVWKAGALAEFDPYPMVKAAAEFLMREGPMTGQERWEENSGFSPSTLAATIAGLICAADFARTRGHHASAGYMEDYADFLESHIERWTVTTQGSLLPGVPRHYIRINPVAAADVSPDEDPNTGVLTIANAPPGRPLQVPAKDVVDAGFLELVRYGIRKAGDPLIEDSLRVVDAMLKVDTPLGPCWRRYNHDAYGNREDGGPFLGWGRGRPWPLLTGERGHYELAAGRSAEPFLRALEKFGGRGAMLPEQVWDEEKPELGMRLGQPCGAALPLMWAHAEYIRLLRSFADDAVFDRVEPVAVRYLAGRGRNDLEIWKPTRQVRAVRRGDTLRIQAPAAFRLRWTDDEWQTHIDTDSAGCGLNLHFVDIAVDPAQHLPIRFTFYWLESASMPTFRRQQESWEGQDYVVRVQ